MADSVERYHLPHIANFHPAYLGLDPSHPRYSAAAAESFLSICEQLHVPCPSLEDWCRFIRDRWLVSLDSLVLTPQHTRMELSTGRGVRGLTVFLPGATHSTRAMLDGRPLNVRTGIFENQEQRYVVLDLAAGKKADLVVLR